MTYAQFLVIFLVPPLLVLLVTLARLRGTAWRSLAWQVPLVGLIAIVYTGPWDGSLIAQGVWSYPPAQVLGGTVLRVPLEEYGFYVLQVALVGLFAAVVWRVAAGRPG